MELTVRVNPWGETGGIPVRGLKGGPAIKMSCNALE